MTPETNLKILLSTMEPVLQPGEYVFATLSPTEFSERQIVPWGWFREPEGISLILEKSEAITAGIDFAFPSRMITLSVHSSLEAVGFLAVITRQLAAAGVSVNAISAYYHDHLFVPVNSANHTMKILGQLMEESLGLTSLPGSE